MCRGEKERDGDSEGDVRGEESESAPKKSSVVGRRRRRETGSVGRAGGLQRARDATTTTTCRARFSPQL